MESLQALDAARELVEIGWCQGADARDGNGRPVKPWDSAAVSWSALGALVAVAATDDGDVVRLEQLGLPALALGIATKSDLLQEWNDEPTRTRADVFAAFSEARALLPRLVEAYRERQ